MNRINIFVFGVTLLSGWCGSMQLQANYRPYNKVTGVIADLFEVGESLQEVVEATSQSSSSVPSQAAVQQARGSLANLLFRGLAMATHFTDDAPYDTEKTMTAEDRKDKSALWHSTDILRGIAGAIGGGSLGDIADELQSAISDADDDYVFGGGSTNTGSTTTGSTTTGSTTTGSTTTGSTTTGSTTTGSTTTGSTTTGSTTTGSTTTGSTATGSSSVPSSAQ